jgi:AbrB family looped-hinge helix DNA binding protein
MQVKVDKFGRMVLPKGIRDDFDIVPGSLLDVEETPDAIILRPVVEKEPLIVKEGVLVYTGRAVGPMEDAVEKARKERNDFLLGPYGKRR